MYNAKSKKAIKKIGIPNPSATFAPLSFGNSHIIEKNTFKAAIKGNTISHLGLGLGPEKAMALTKISHQ